MRTSGRIVEADELTGSGPILVLAPHPDDESLGCGALLAHAFRNHDAHVVCMTDGAASHPRSSSWDGRRLAAERQSELIGAVRQLGGSSDDVTFLCHPDGWLGACDRDAVAADLVGRCERRNIARIFAPWCEDRHEDHKATADIAVRMRNALPSLQVFSYPVWGRWDDPDFDAHVRQYDPLILPLGAFRDLKKAAVRSHATQLGLRIDDDPDGFVMPKAFVDAFTEGDEIFWSVPA